MNLDPCPSCTHPIDAHCDAGCMVWGSDDYCQCDETNGHDWHFDFQPAVDAWTQMTLNEKKGITVDIDPEPTDTQHLATAIENGLLTLAESIKYAVDTWAERNPLPVPIVPENKPWHPAMIGDKIILTGLGTSNEDYWRGKLVTVTGITGEAALEWKEDATGKQDHGCFNAEGRFHHVQT